jgi:hypothetical protein
MSAEVPVVYFNNDSRLPGLLNLYPGNTWIDYRPGSAEFEGYRATLTDGDRQYPVIMLIRRGPFIHTP